MCDILMIYFGWQTFSERIRNHGVCAYVFNQYLKTLNSFFHNQELDVNVFGLWRTLVVLRIQFCGLIISIDSQWFLNPINNSQLSDKIPQPYPMVWCLVASYKFCLHGGRSNECLFNTFPWHCSSSQHEDVVWSGSLIVKTSYEIGVRISHDLQMTGSTVCEHIVFSSL